MTQNYPLMHNNITKNDINQVISFLKKNPVLTQSKKVEKFEKAGPNGLVLSIVYL